MTRTIKISEHAIDRYIERVENCSRDDAEDRLVHALEISKAASPAMVSRFVGNRHTFSNRKNVYRYCSVENLFLICMGEKRGGLAVITVFRATPKRCQEKRT